MLSTAAPYNSPDKRTELRPSRRAHPLLWRLKMVEERLFTPFWKYWATTFAAGDEAADGEPMRKGLNKPERLGGGPEPDMWFAPRIEWVLKLRVRWYKGAPNAVGMASAVITEWRAVVLEVDGGWPWPEDEWAVLVADEDE